MRKRVLTLLAVMALAAGLAACGGGSGGASAVGQGGSKKAACSVLTPQVAKVALGVSYLPTAGPITQNTSPEVPGICDYTAMGPNKQLVSVDLLLYYGHSAVEVFDETVNRSLPTITVTSGSFALTFSKVQVNGTPAYWQPNKDPLYGLISAADGNYVLHVTMEGRTGSEPILENALGAAEQNL